MIHHTVVAQAALCGAGWLCSADCSGCALVMNLNDNGIALVGRKVRRKFGNEYYIGSITHYNHDKWWHVTYDDGDKEDLNCSELRRAKKQQIKTADKKTAEPEAVAAKPEAVAADQIRTLR